MKDRLRTLASAVLKAITAFMCVSMGTLAFLVSLWFLLVAEPVHAQPLKQSKPVTQVVTVCAPVRHAQVAKRYKTESKELIIKLVPCFKT